MIGNSEAGLPVDSKSSNMNNGPEDSHIASAHSQAGNTMQEIDKEVAEAMASMDAADLADITGGG